MGDRITELKRQARSTDEELRLQAIKALYDTCDIRGIPVLRTMADKDSSVKVRYVAKKALTLLKQVMQDEVQEVERLSISTILSREEVQAQLAAEASGATFNLKSFTFAYYRADAKKRARYIQAALRYNARELLPFLCEQAALAEDEDVRSSLAIALGVLGAGDQLIAVAAFLSDESPRVRASAIEGLEQLGIPEAFPYVSKGLSDRDKGVRAAAARVMHKVGRVKVICHLDEMLSSDHTWMHDSAAYCLAMLASDSVLPLMKKAMTNPDREVRRKVRAGVERLVRRGNAEAVELLQQFSDSTGDFGVEDVAVFASVEAVDGDDPLASDDPEQRKAEVERIVDEGAVDRVPALCVRIEIEEDPYVKASMVNALGRLGDVAATEVLCSALRDRDARVRGGAVEALASLSPDALVPLARGLFADENNQVRADAIIALKDRCEGEAFEALGRMAEHEDLTFRRSAFLVACDIGDERIIPVLKGFLSDDSKELRTRAIHHVHLMKSQKDGLYEKVLEALGPQKRTLLRRPMQTEIVARAFAVELPAAVEAEATEGGVVTGPPSISGIQKKFQYEAFKALPQARKLDVIDKAKAVATVANFSFLNEVVEKEDDFTVKVAARRALKCFETAEFSASLRRSEKKKKPKLMRGGNLARAVEYRGTKQPRELAAELAARAEARGPGAIWEGSFPATWPTLNALREDTQELLTEVIGEEEILTVTLCHYRPELLPFLAGEESLDLEAHASVVNLSEAYRTLVLKSPNRRLMHLISGSVYLLAVLTPVRLILFLRGPLHRKKAAYQEVHYHRVRKARLHEKGPVSTIELLVGLDAVEVPEVRADEGTDLFALLQAPGAEEA